MQSSTQSSTSVIPITQTSATQEQRQVSQSSTLSESIDSAEGGVILCSRETATLYMVNDFLGRVMQIWKTSASLENLPSKRELALQWAGYVPTILLPIILLALIFSSLYPLALISFALIFLEA